MRTTKIMVVTGLAVAGLAGCAAEGDQISADEQGVDSLTSAGGIAPTIVAGNPTCEELGFDGGIKVDPPTPGTYTLYPGKTVTWTSADGHVVDWSSQLPISAVIVKGGTEGANVYNYEPEESLGDRGLYTPRNPSGEPAAISHVNFCWDWELEVTKTATTSFTRAFAWDITKVVDQASLLLTPGQTHFVNYVVSVARSFVDRDFAVAGTITVTNPSPFAATVTGVSDDFGGAALPVDCGVAFPYELAAGASLACTYAAPLASATGGTNTATATTSAAGRVGGDTGTAEVVFGEPTTTTDECVVVDDTLVGSLGTTCAPATFAYPLAAGPFATCGAYTIDNTATFTANDTGATGSATASVAVEVPCAGGCSLTQGYWRTHSSHGPAPYDDTWAQLPAGADTAFFLSGMTYHQVLWTAPAGNGYFVLAPQYIAAQLNGLNGADTSAISAAFARATTLLQTYTPAQVGALKKSPLRSEFVALAAALDAYNNGLTGPGHCSE